MPKPNISAVIKNKWEYLLPVTAFLAAFFLRHYFLTMYSHPLMINEQDAVGYMDVAKSFLQLKFPDVTGRPPGYPIIIALFAIFSRDLEYAARLASIFMDALIVLPLFYIARIYLSRASSLSVCLLWAFFPLSLVFSPSPLSQSSYLCYLLFGIAFLLSGVKNRLPGLFSVSGVFFAFAYLARPEGIVGYGCGFIICLTLVFENGALNKKNILFPACFLLGLLLFAGPYLIALHSVFGNWTMTPVSEATVKTTDALQTLNAKGELASTGSTGLSAWKEQYKTFPIFLNAVWANIRAFAVVYQSTFPIWIHLITGIGFLTIAWKCRWRYFAILLILIAVTAPVLVVNIPKAYSYIYPVYAMTFISFVFFFETVESGVTWTANKFLPNVGYKFIEIFLSGILVLTISYAIFFFYNSADINYQSPMLSTEVLTTEKIYKGASEIIRDNSGINDVIMTRWGLIGYFANRRVIALPKGGVKEVIDYGRKNGVGFILLDTNTVFSRRQELKELLGPLERKAVNPAYGIELFGCNYFRDIGGYVIYRYKR